MAGEEEIGINVRLKLLWQVILRLICVQKVHGLPVQIHIWIVSYLTRCRRILRDDPSKLLDGWLKTCVPLTLQGSLWMVVREISPIWITLTVLVGLCNVLVYWMCTRVQNADAFWSVPVIGSSDTVMKLRARIRSSSGV